MRLGVNIDHIATLRQTRMADEPDPVAAAVIAELAGADGITIHMRQDRRHIQEKDLELLRKTVKTKLNLEMAVSMEMVKIPGMEVSAGRGRQFNRIAAANAAKIPPEGLREQAH